MFSTAPLFSMSAFIIGFIAVLLIGRALSEYRHNKSPSSVGAQDRRIKTASKAVKNYYNRNYDEIKGA